ERVVEVGDLARLDPDRVRRKGVPEVIYAPGKSPADTARLATVMSEAAGFALVSRVDADHDEALAAAAAAAGAEYERFGSGRRLVARGASRPQPAPGGPAIGILAAGTSDVDVAEEARMVAETMGVTVTTAYDVGVSALHRLAEPLAAMLKDAVDALVVVAGMEGALPSVVGGLVSAPVIAVPTSVGYGAGGGGLAALLGMLQSCSPGITVVNIDNGIGAGASAGLIAVRAAAARARAADPRPV
ncbi:MAG: pyridinium-3,5-biscarboxylic acid mononucleotide synthase, partial [Chloroflexota bacterium]|nr:pyridinium-3,5-biscarboxylic acid mononucleotide synthase [Chloroflexota bacterium]